MNAELAALLRAAKETPDDDAPRLVIADWLDEHGEPARAELLRTQCHTGHRSSADTALLRDRADALIAEHGERWWGCLVSGVQPAVNRGFLIVALPFRLLQDGLDACPLRDAWEQGWVDTLIVNLWNAPPTDPWPFLAACPWLAGVSALSLPGPSFDQQAADYLTRSPHLESLLSLTVSSGLTPAAERSLIESPNLPRLIRLNGDANGPRVAAALREAAVTGVLRLERVNISWGNGRAILNHAAVPINEVRIANCQMGKAELRTLLARPGLRGLHFQHDFHGSNEARSIAKYAPPTLAWLRLPSSRINHDACAALARSDRLAGLRLLDLSGNDGLGEAGVIALARSPHLAGLWALDLRDTPLSADAVAELARAVTFPRMRRIVLSDAGLNPTRRASLLARYGSALTLASPGSSRPAIELPENAS